MTVDDFNIYALITILIWSIAFVVLSFNVLQSFFLKKENKTLEIIYNSLSGIGFLVLSYFTVLLWIKLERPPMRTTGETRLWYSIFVILISYTVYIKWKYKAILGGGLLFSIVFLLINIIKPEAMSKTLAPALQSNWFIPHVIVYILSYAILGLSWFVAILGLIPKLNKNLKGKELIIADNLVYIGFGFLTLGLVFGAFWAKEAWGHYWTWDPKETWAMITWLAYLLYIHYRLNSKHTKEKALWILVIAFALLIICWFGINYMAVGSNSVHTYSS